jgi:hypothetical protein
MQQRGSLSSPAAERSFANADQQQQQAAAMRPLPQRPLRAPQRSRFATYPVGYTAQPYWEEQRDRFCAVHALNAFLGYRAVTPEQMHDYRRSLSRDAQVWDGNDQERGAPLELDDQDRTSDDGGDFTRPVIALWLQEHTGYGLAPVQVRGATADGSGLYDPQQALVPMLSELEETHGARAFYCTIPGHMVAVVRAADDAWWWVDSLAEPRQI